MRYSILLLILLFVCCNSDKIDVQNTPKKVENDSVQIPELTAFQTIHRKQMNLLKELPEIRKEISCDTKFEYQKLKEELIEFIDVPKGNYQAVQGRLIKECFLILFKNKEEGNLFQLNSYRFLRKEIQGSIIFGNHNCDNPKEIKSKLLLKFPFKLVLIEKDTINYKIEWNGILTRK
jgi:hypothetical protein